MVVADQHQGGGGSARNSSNQHQNHQQHQEDEATANAERNAMIESVIMQPVGEASGSTQQSHDTTSLYSIDDFNLEPLQMSSGPQFIMTDQNMESPLDSRLTAVTSRLLRSSVNGNRSPGHDGGDNHDNNGECNQQQHSLHNMMPAPPINLGDLCANTIACSSPMTQISSLQPPHHATYSISAMAMPQMNGGQGSLAINTVSQHKYPGTPPDTPPGTSPSPPYHNLTAVIPPPGLGSPVSAASLLSHTSIDVTDLIWKNYQVSFILI